MRAYRDEFRGRVLKIWHCLSARLGAFCSFTCWPSLLVPPSIYGAVHGLPSRNICFKLPARPLMRFGMENVTSRLVHCGASETRSPARGRNDFGIVPSFGKAGWPRVPNS